MSGWVQSEMMVSKPDKRWKVSNWGTFLFPFWQNNVLFIEITCWICYNLSCSLLASSDIISECPVINQTTFHHPPASPLNQWSPLIWWKARLYLTLLLHLSPVTHLMCPVKSYSSCLYAFSPLWPTTTALGCLQAQSCFQPHLDQRKLSPGAFGLSSSTGKWANGGPRYGAQSAALILICWICCHLQFWG